MKLCVYEFNMGDVEDPELYAAEPLYKWEHSEVGQWVMKNSKTKPSWNISTCPNTYGWKCYVTANLEGEALTFFKLKWG